MKKIVVFLLCAFGMSVVLSAQKRKEINTPVTVNYCLPKVVYTVNVKVEYSRYIPGPYAQYAEDELGIKPESMILKEQWRIKSVEITPRYIPDENTVYAMMAAGDYNPVMLTLSPEGFLAGIASGPQELKAVQMKMTYIPWQPNSERSVDMTSLRTYNPLKEVLDTNYVEQEIDGVIKRIWDPIIRYEAKTAKDLMSEAVKEIFRIRSERTKLLAAENEVPDGRSLQVILEEFERMERDYLSLFLGREIKQTYERSFECTLEKADEAVVAFRFSEAQGFVDKKNVSAMAYSLVAENVIVPAEAETVAAEQVQTVIYYRTPAVADVKLVRANEVLQSFRDVIPQLGIIKRFPTDIISVEGLHLEFYPHYGSLKSINRIAR